MMYVESSQMLRIKIPFFLKATLLFYLEWKNNSMSSVEVTSGRMDNVSLLVVFLDPNSPRSPSKKSTQ